MTYAHSFRVILVFLASDWILRRALEWEKKIGFCRIFSPTTNVEMAGQQFLSLGDGYEVKAVSKLGSYAGDGSLLQQMQMFLMDRVLPSPLVTDPIPKIPSHLSAIIFSNIWKSLLLQGRINSSHVSTRNIIVVFVNVQAACPGKELLRVAGDWNQLPIEFHGTLYL